MALSGSQREHNVVFSPQSNILSTIAWQRQKVPGHYRRTVPSAGFTPWNGPLALSEHSLSFGLVMFAATHLD